MGIEGSNPSVSAKHRRLPDTIPKTPPITALHHCDIKGRQTYAIPDKLGDLPSLVIARKIECQRTPDQMSVPAIENYWPFSYSALQSLAATVSVKR